MGRLPQKLSDKISKRASENALRRLLTAQGKIDFTSNDYLGYAKSELLQEETLKILKQNPGLRNGSTGSRLLSGQSDLFEQTENLLAEFYRSKASLIFNSGYDANMGVLSSIPQRGDLVLYDEFVHASIRDGITSSRAKHLKFKHNDLEDLKKVLENYNQRSNHHNNDAIYVVTESVFSMDGDSPDLSALVRFCDKENYYLIVDEAHAVGVYGRSGAGLIEELKLADRVFARIVTFGKALGCHGAAVLGSAELKNYLVNFARSFIYTTALSPHSVATIYAAHALLSSAEGDNARNALRERIDYFRVKLEEYEITDSFILSNSAIQSCIVPGNQRVKKISEELIHSNYDVRPILSPTVAMDKERLRFCLHNYNTESEIDSVLNKLALCLKNL